MDRALRRVVDARLRRDKANDLLVEAIRAARKEKHTLRDIADCAGMTHETVRKYGDDNADSSTMEKRRRATRDERMKNDRIKGATLQAIADKFGLTRERVRQIVSS